MPGPGGGGFTKCPYVYIAYYLSKIVHKGGGGQNVQNLSTWFMNGPYCHFEEFKHIILVNMSKSESPLRVKWVSSTLEIPAQ